MDLREIGWEDVDWMHLAQQHDSELSASIKDGKFRD
jgi:hypothetical protein